MKPFLHYTFIAVLLIACARLWMEMGHGLAESPRGHLPAVGHQAVRTSPSDAWLESIGSVLEGAPGTQDPARRLFRRVMDEVRRHDYEAGMAGFRLFLEMYDQSPLVPQAEFWLGECEFQLAHYQNAISAFDQALSHAPLNPQLAAAAFMKKGTSFAQLGETARSRHLLELVVVEFPHSDEAGQARRALTIR